MTDNPDSAEIIDFTAARFGWLAGPARCLSCHHEWAVAAPRGCHAQLECPACGLLKGELIGAVVPEGDRQTCACGNDIFFLTPDGAVCALCGLEQ